MKRNILFVCSFNAGRSILAESVMNAVAGEHFVGYSAGEAPRPGVHPDALALLQAKGHDTSPLRSKSWREFMADNAPPIDLAITLCNNAEGEMCMDLASRFPVAHWDIPDPALGTTEDERRLLFEQAYACLRRDILDMVDLPEIFVGERFANAVTRIGYTKAA